MNISVLGIDIAKNIFHVYGVDSKGKNLVNKAVKRNKLLEYIAQIPKCLIGMEACGGANYWGQKFREIGHEVKLMGAQFVKPYVKSNKNDMADAEAICEAVGRPNMRFVAIKSKEQQDIQGIHRIRARLVREKIAISNQLRSLLHEYGVVMKEGINHVIIEVPEILEKEENGLTKMGREFFVDLHDQLKKVVIKVEEYNRKIETICESNEVCKMLVRLPGIGALTATAIVGTIGDAKVFKSGRELAAYLGLVPKQHSSGGKERMLGISKRGDRYLRCLLIHGARATMFQAKRLPEEKRGWINELIKRRGRGRGIVALANKNARLIWAVMTKGENFNWNKATRES